jgi:glycosyltransferase involved in cell wall biosynthesis
LETAACRVPIVHRGTFPSDDYRKNYISAQPKDSDFLLELLRFENDYLYRERIAQKTWRYAFFNNTFSHRIQKICKNLSINHNLNEFPKATVITPTIRPKLIDRCIQQYDLQTYPNKELIIVFNGPNEHVESHEDYFKYRSDIKLLTIPNEYYAGTSLNMGINQSKGEVCFRMDDDDHYGKNYILDAMLYLKAVDAELLGKAFAYLHLENKGIYRRPEKQLPPSIFLGKDLDYSKVPIAGCSIAGKKDTFTKVRYPDKNAFAADTMLKKIICSDWGNLIGVLLDQMNMVVERKEDVSKHTWQIDNQRIISSSIFTSYNIEDLMV